MTDEQLLQHQKNLEYIRNFTIMDDDFMSKVFEDYGCVELILRIILDISDLSVKEVQTQYELKNFQGRSVRLDIYADDSRGRKYNIEIQKNNSGANIKRARYNSSILDANITEPGDDYDKLCETYVIFITQNDVIGLGEPIYHIERVVRESGQDFGDGSHIIYVNAQIKDNTELGKLMQDFWEKDVNKMNYDVLAERVRYFKENKEGVNFMSSAMDELRREAEKNAKINFAMRMLKLGKFSYEEIWACEVFSVN